MYCIFIKLFEDDILKIAVSFLQIHERQLIILTAHSDAEPIQKYLTEMVFPAWLEHYNFDYISLISKLALNADEIEYLQTEEIQKIVLEALFE